MTNQLWIESVGDLIIARIRGVPTEAILKECHDRVFLLVKELGHGCILYDALELEVPPVEVPLFQWKLDEELGPIHLKRAIVVSNSKLAYLARLAFGDGDHRVFYNDMTGAIRWLTDSPYEE